MLSAFAVMILTIATVVSPRLTPRALKTDLQRIDQILILPTGYRVFIPGYLSSFM